MKRLAEHRRARHDYEILETFEAGLVLNGTEVKSAREGRMQIAGSYVIPRRENLWLVGAQIPPFQPANAPEDYDPGRDRKLLLHKRELRTLLGKAREKGLTLIPLFVYSTARGFLKLAFGVARGKKTRDRREEIGKREAQRDIDRALKRG